jgi:hypothetical protein
MIPESHFSVQKFDEVFIGKKYGEEFRHFFLKTSGIFFLSKIYFALKLMVWP